MKQHATLLEDYEENPFTLKQAKNLEKAARAQGRKPSGKVAAKLRSGKKGRKGRRKAKKNPGRKRGRKRGRKKARKNPKRSYRRKGRKRTKRNPWYSTKRVSKGHSKAGRKGARRKGYKSNKRGRKRKYRRNPSGLGKGSRSLAMFTPFHLLNKKNRGIYGKGMKALKGLAFTGLGLFDTSAYGALIDMATVGLADSNEKSAIRDAVRIGGKFAAGTLTSMLIAKVTKKKNHGLQHQVGVWASIILDLIGTAWKHTTKATKGMAFKGMGQIEFVPNLKSVTVELMGMGQIDRAWAERKIIVSLQKGEVIQVSKHGKMGRIESGTSGDVLAYGSFDSCAKFAGQLTGAGAHTFGYTPPARGLGEDITIEG